MSADTSITTGTAPGTGTGGTAPTAGSELRGLLEVIGAMVLAGSSVVVGKLLSVRIPVFLAAELSLLAALAAILPLQAARWKELAGLGRRELGSMFLQALFGIVLFRVFTLSALHLTSAASAGVITSAAPAVMALAAAAFLRERVGRRGSIGICLAVVGLLVVNIFGRGDVHGGVGTSPGTSAGSSAGSLGGNLLVLGATFCEALLTVFRKSSGGRTGSVTNTTVLVGMSAVMVLPFALLDLRGFDPGRVGLLGWLSVAYYGSVATVIAYILWGHGALLIPAARTGIATAALPVSALALSALVLGEPLGSAHVAGCALVVAGIVLGSL